MSISDILESLKVLTPRMVALALLHPLRAARRVVRITCPELRGPAFWQAVIRAVRSPARPAPAPVETFSGLGPVTGVVINDPNRITAVTSEGHLQIRVLASDLVEVRAAQDDSFPPPFSYSVARPPDAWNPPPAQITDGERELAITTSDLRITLDKPAGRLLVRDGKGNLLFEQNSGAAWQRDGQQVLWRARFDPATAFYGLGEKASTLNHAGKRLELWNTDPIGYGRDRDPIYLSVPFVVTLHNGAAAGLYFDNTHRSWIDLGAEEAGVLTYQAAGGELRLYVMAGTPEGVLERYTELTGRTRLPPLWALGFHQSRWSYYPQQRVLEVAEEFRKRQIPCDVIHLDIHYMDDYRCFTWNPRRFPDPRGMIEALHEQGFKVLSMIDPGIQTRPGYHVYDEGIAQDAFIKYPDGKRFTGPVWPGDCHFPDFSDPAVREWWGGLYRGLLDDGMDAFWNDMNEPALITLGDGDTKDVPGIVCHSKEGQGADHAEMHNVYGLLMTRASSEGLARLRPERRPLILTRSGWAGVQRHAIHWTGDNHSTWDHLRLSIQMALNLGLSGIPITGPDIGGFSGAPPGELFARWIQLGALMPFCRAHSKIGTPDQEPWAFGPEVEAISRKYLELRYRLLPYLYTTVWQAAQRGLPVMRPLSFAYPHDTRTYSLDDQYLFGDALLAAPVLEEGASGRRVLLPEGSWYDFWTNRRYEGPQTLNVATPLDMLPLFVRGGAVVPFWPVQQYVGEKTIDTLELHAYRAEGEHTSFLYEDDGLCADYEAPARHRVSRFTLEGESAADLSITRHIEQGHYAGACSHLRLSVIGLKQAPARIELEGGDLLAQTWDNATSTLHLEADAAGAFALRLR